MKEGDLRDDGGYSHGRYQSPESRKKPVEATGSFRATGRSNRQEPSRSHEKQGSGAQSHAKEENIWTMEVLTCH